MNFILRECTHLRYYMPLIIEGNKHNIKSVLYIGFKGKYNCPSKYMGYIQELSKKYNIELRKVEDLKNNNDIVFCVEGNGLEFVSQKSKKIVLLSQSDFRDKNKYPKYIHKVDYVIFPSKKFAEYYGTLSNKNLYLGSPKYDIKLDRDKILQKYNLPQQKKALVIFPRIRCLKNCGHIIKKVYKTLEDMGYLVLLKTRGKTLVPKEYQIEKYFIDNSWFPHTTMELIEISDIVIGFNSTGIEEILMGRKPLLNYDVEIEYGIQERGLGFLYNYGYCIDNNLQSLNIKEDIEYLINADLEKDYDKAIEECMFDSKNVSYNILKAVGKI